LYTCGVGDDNVAGGHNTLYYLTSGDKNAAIGNGAGQDVTTGSNNVFMGYDAGFNVTTSQDHTFVGAYAGYTCTNQSHNTYIGSYSGYYQTNSGNTVVGYRAFQGSSSANGYSNTVMGYSAAKDAETGTNNSTVIGYEAGKGGTTSGSNTWVGYQAGVLNTTGGNNVVVGYYSGRNISTGDSNVLIGTNVGTYVTNLTTGQRNVLIGPYARVSSTSVSDAIVIGYNITDKGAETAFIGGSNGAYQENNSSNWSTTSDRRIKKNIEDNTTGLDKINQIQVRNFEYRTKEEITDFENTDAVMVDVKGVQLGVIAQEIQEVLPDVVEELETGALSVNPDNITWYLVNAVKELSAKVKALEAG